MNPKHAGKPRASASGLRLHKGLQLLLLPALLAIPAFSQTDGADAPAAPDSSSAPSGPGDAYAPSEGQPYGGPSLLSRDFSPEPRRTRTSFVPSTEIAGIYDSGLNGIIIDPKGGVRSAASAGVQYSFGIDGQWAWRHASLALSYSGSANRYLSSAAYNNSSQSLSLGFTRLLNRHVTLSVRNAGSIYSRSFTQSTLSSTYLPALDIYGNRTSAFNTQIALMVQKTARLSFSVAGAGGLTHQASTVVYDIGSATVMADAQYRLSQRSTVGVSYSFSDFIYPGSFSSTRYHSVSGNYAVALSRRTEFSLSGGFLKSESRFLEAVPLDPILAYLIGIRSTLVVNHQIRNLPSGGARLSRTFSRGSASVSGGYSVVPGNGLFLATVAAYVSGSYSYTGLQRWNLSAGGSYSQGTSIGTSLGHYGSSGGNFSASRQLSRYMHAVIGFSAVRYQSAVVSYYNRLIYQASIGIGFSPGNIPLGPR